MLRPPPGRRTHVRHWTAPLPAQARIALQHCEHRAALAWCVRSLVVGAYAEASDDLHQLFDCVVDSASKQHWRRIGARSAKEARSYFATTLRRACGVHFAREFARHRIRRVVFVGAPRRQPGRQASRDGRWRLASAVGGRVCGARAARRRRVGGRPARPSVSTGREGRSALN